MATARGLTRQTGGMLDPSVIPPAGARTFTAHRRARLSDLDAGSRVRLDAVARFLQDAAIDDAQETGWGTPDHLWVIRSIQIDVISPLLRDREVEIETWGSGVAVIAAGRRWSVAGDAGGRAEIDSVWIHLGPDLRPARIGDFGPYGIAAGGRSVSTKLMLPDPPADALRSPWALRSTDLDTHGHVNNAVYWQAVEDRFAREGVSLAEPHRARLDYRDPIDLDDDVTVAGFDGGDSRRCLAFVVGGRARAVASVEPLVGG
jgi:acyl-ACP thioesterase